MKNEISTTQGAAINPFQRAPLAEHGNVGTIEVESARAIAEAQGKLVIAKRFPRNEARAYEEAMQACRRPGLAEDAFWSFPRGDGVLTGTSIHLARELARIWGNIDYGIRELSRKDGVSEMQAYAWDLQTNALVTQNFTVRHWRDTKRGGYQLTDERDIYEITANQGSRRLRGCINSVLPSDLVKAAEEECKKTLDGNNDEPAADRVRKLIAAFAKLGVTVAMIEDRLGHSLDTVLPEELAEMRSIFTSIKQGLTTAGEWFGGLKAEPTTAADVLDGDPTDPPAPAAKPAPKPATKKAKPAPAPEVPTDDVPEQAPTTPTAEGEGDDGDIFG
jgi:hypothetical protein